MFQIPTVSPDNLIQERGAKRAVARDTFVFGDEVENPLRAAENVRMDRGRIVQAGNLWLYATSFWLERCGHGPCEHSQRRAADSRPRRRIRTRPGRQPAQRHAPRSDWR